MSSSLINWEAVPLSQKRLDVEELIRNKYQLIDVYKERLKHETDQPKRFELRKRLDEQYDKVAELHLQQEDLIKRICHSDELHKKNK